MKKAVVLALVASAGFAAGANKTRIQSSLAPRIEERVARIRDNLDPRVPPPDLVAAMRRAQAAQEPEDTP